MCQVGQRSWVGGAGESPSRSAQLGMTKTPTLQVFADLLDSPLLKAAPPPPRSLSGGSGGYELTMRGFWIGGSVICIFSKNSENSRMSVASPTTDVSGVCRITRIVDIMLFGSRSDYIPIFGLRMDFLRKSPHTLCPSRRLQSSTAFLPTQPLPSPRASGISNELSSSTQIGK